MNISSTIPVLILGFLTIGGFGYMNFNNQLTEAKSQISQLQKQLNENKEEIQNKEQKIKDLSESQGSMQQDLHTRLEEVRRLQANMGTLSQCLEGVVNLVAASSNNDEGAVVFILSSIAEPCRQSDLIIQEIQRVNTNKEGSSAQTLSPIFTNR